MDNLIDYDQVKSVLHHLNTDDTIASAHGILCGFACIKPDLALDDWLGEVLVSIDLNNLSEKSAHEQLAQIYNNTLLQLGDATLNFQLLIADEDSTLREQADTLIQWCQGFLVGLGLQKISTNDEDVLLESKNSVARSAILILLGYCFTPLRMWFSPCFVNKFTIYII